MRDDSWVWHVLCFFLGYAVSSVATDFIITNTLKTQAKEQIIAGAVVATPFIVEECVTKTIEVLMGEK